MQKTPEANYPEWMGKLKKSLQQTRGAPESRYFQLATCDFRGMPQVRTLVLRELDSTSTILYAFSDLRTEKIAELRQCNDCALCWYFAANREQYRMSCKATVVTIQSDPNRLRACWNTMSEQGKKQYFWGHPKALLADSQTIKSEATTSEPPSHFCLIALEPYEVDYLSLKATPHHRMLHTKNNDEWVARAVIP
ncbi:pyridoxamine 5'-phosphate oxidase family protein [Aestuariibacter sp. A3R04]|uniref:pyridoxamine 5'-phosphate oxidase family protein n=1 Tax=Aestuariibacter sp. A3R04 TaxID=2841571 RepID=UPI001C094DF3|nr:pyridoxamine 5'-phosphate oxidase family protein [Aestuariibacter sp. A3R04]MBU3022728.1 pyridoxamine 5'-phosphate oxidase family protein [Aestuariibacter sp. A3R04]